MEAYNNQIKSEDVYVCPDIATSRVRSVMKEVKK